MADVAYCMKCREKREFTGTLVTLKNGRPALQGTCPVCGTKLTKIMGMDAAKAMGWKAPLVQPGQQLFGAEHDRPRSHLPVAGREVRHRRAFEDLLHRAGDVGPESLQPTA